jgi:hypothetical protein
VLAADASRHSPGKYADPSSGRAFKGNRRWKTPAGIKLYLIFESKRQLHLHTVLRDLVFVIEYNFLILDPITCMQRVPLFLICPPLAGVL